MSENSQTQLQLYANQILNDYDTKNPSILFKNNINISVVDAYKIQSIVTNLRIKRGEKVVGYKIGSISKQTQKKYGFSHPAWGRLWESELHKNGVELNKKDYLNIKKYYQKINKVFCTLYLSVMISFYFLQPF